MSSNKKYLSALYHQRYGRPTQLILISFFFAIASFLLTSLVPILDNQTQTLNSVDHVGQIHVRIQEALDSIKLPVIVTLSGSCVNYRNVIGLSFQREWGIFIRY